LRESYIDCEDKSLLLAFLYKELLDVQSVLLLFHKQKHAALGVQLPGYERGFSFRYEGNTYVSCEPTGANYPLGKAAIDLKEVTEVIELY